MKHYEALRAAFPDFGWREVRGEAKEHMGEMYAFVVEAPDGMLYGAVPMSQSAPDEDGWVGYDPLNGVVDHQRPAAADKTIGRPKPLRIEVNLRLLQRMQKGGATRSRAGGRLVLVHTGRPRGRDSRSRSRGCPSVSCGGRAAVGPDDRTSSQALAGAPSGVAPDPASLP